MYQRLITLIGDDNFNTFKNTKVLLVGCGGVGSYALEGLVRNGFSNITVIDFDTIDITNLNRQLITDSTNVGTLKIDAAVKRAKLINPDVNINGINLKLDVYNIKDILNEEFDYVIDACDDINVKFALINLSLKYNYKLISSMGTAKKNDPTKLSITTLDKTSGDPLARVLRKKVKDAHINKKIYVVSSSEIPQDLDILGSNNLVPSVAGLLCVSYIYNDILKNNK